MGTIMLRLRQSQFQVDMKIKERAIGRELHWIHELKRKAKMTFRVHGQQRENRRSHLKVIAPSEL